MITASEQPNELSAIAIAGKIARRELSALEALGAHVAHIERHNPVLNALVSLDVERARDAARAADEALAHGERMGSLHGVPMALKDAHDVAGLRTTIGAPPFDRIATQDGTIAARLRAAGAIIVGHSNVPPFLSDYQSANPIFGRTNNPWDVQRTPGGSSGGAAAALAARMTPLEVGSDLAGSLRLPAHFCGVYGLKPTEHRVSMHGFFQPPSPTPRSVRIISCIGPMARNLEDLHLALEVIAGPDGRDSDVVPVPLRMEQPRALGDLRLWFSPTLPTTHVSATTRQQLERIAARTSDAGATVQSRSPEIEWDALHALFGSLVQTITGLFDPFAQLSAEQRSLASYFASLERRDQFIAQWHTFFETCDALILPVAMTTAFTHCDPGSAIDVDGRAQSYDALGALLVFCNLVGLPALSVPAGFDSNGMPMGIQLIGPRWSELRLLTIARQLEELEILPGFVPPSGY